MLEFFKGKNVKTINELRYEMYAYYLQKTFLAKKKFKDHRDFAVISKIYKANYLKWRERYWNVLTAIELVELLKVKKDEEVNPLLHNTANQFLLVIIKYHYLTRFLSYTDMNVGEY